MSGDFKKFLIIIVAGTVVFPFFSLAQVYVDIPAALVNELGIEVTPEYPRPHENVSIRLSLYTDDLNLADITWLKDGKIVSEGRGKVTYSLKMGAAGEETKIELKIKLLSGISFSKSFILNPASVDLIWEANSYVPPFYKGKALHSRQGPLKMVAMPEFVSGGKRVDPEKLVYQWSNGVEVYQSQSGYGKNVILINSSLLGRTEKVEVLVTDPAHGLVAQGFADVVPVDPKIIFYQNDPYYGHIFDLALAGVFKLDKNEVRVLAAPYYFTKESDGLLKYEWRLNGQLVSGLFGSRTAIFKKPEGKSGQSTISLNIENQNRILQQADGKFSINFEGN